MLNPVCDRPGGKSIFTIVIPAQTGILLPSFMDTPAWMQVVERRLERAAEEVLYAARGQGCP